MLTEITKKVINRSNIPEEFTRFAWFNVYAKDSLVEAHISDQGEHDGLHKWFLENYPELEDEESFFIKID